VGCNFRCAWCQNWDISQYRAFDPESDAIGQSLLPVEIVNHCRANDIPMVAFTYNEPVVFFEYAYDTARLAHDEDLRTVFVSSGYETIEALDTIAPYLDAANIDLKAFRKETYQDLCGARLAPVVRNIEHLAGDTDVWLEVTTLIIPQLNDSDGELRELASFLADISPDIPWHISAFAPHYQMRDRPPTSAATLRRAWEIGKEAGLHYVYTGNIWNDRSLRDCTDTHCPVCETVVIQRAGYSVHTSWDTPGVCPQCGTAIAGVWR
jgi:pyruvate formate lyase activating enzyme